jgi:hypothetical protein
MNSFQDFPVHKMSPINPFVFFPFQGQVLRADGIRAFPVVTYLAGGTCCTAGPAVACIGAKVYFASVSYFLVTVGIVGLALLNNTFPLHA